MMYVVTTNVFNKNDNGDGYLFGIFDTEELAMKAIKEYVHMNSFDNLQEGNSTSCKSFIFQDLYDDEWYNFYIEVCYVNTPLV